MQDNERRGTVDEYAGRMARRREAESARSCETRIPG